jgi:hypothetical protein
MKSRILILGISLFSLVYCYHEWIHRAEIKGLVLDYKTHKPIQAIVSFVPIPEEDIVDKTNTDINGFFRFQKISSKDWAVIGLEKPKGPPSSNKIIFLSKNFIIDTIDLSEKEIKDNVINLDTIYLKKDK